MLHDLSSKVNVTCGRFKIMRLLPREFHKAYATFWAIMRGLALNFRRV
jgi:hypothetical protein